MKQTSILFMLLSSILGAAHGMEMQIEQVETLFQANDLVNAIQTNNKQLTQTAEFMLSLKENTAVNKATLDSMNKYVQELPSSLQYVVDVNKQMLQELPLVPTATIQSMHYYKKQLIALNALNNQLRAQHQENLRPYFCIIANNLNNSLWITRSYLNELKQKETFGQDLPLCISPIIQKLFDSTSI